MRGRKLRILGYAGPAAAGLLLVAMLASGGIDARRPPQTVEYFAEVKAGIERIPYQIGPWTGVDQEVIPAAVRMLKPNKILQRRYLNPATGEWFNLLFVHCGDVRDMQGHYPPICYPAHGWRQERAAPVTLTAEGTLVRAKEYDFRQPAGPRESGMVVLNFFVLPSGRYGAPLDGSVGSFTGDIDAVRRAARSRAMAGLGAAQVQIVTSSDLPEADRQRIVQDVLPALGPAVQRIAEGMNHE